MPNKNLFAPSLIFLVFNFYYPSVSLVEASPQSGDFGLSYSHLLREGVSSLHSNYREISQNDNVNKFLSDDDIEYISEVLRMVDLKKTPLNELIEHRDYLPHIDQLIQAMTKLTPALSKALTESKQPRKNVLNNTHTDNSELPPQPQPYKKDENNNYENCVRDYAAYIEPLTNRLYNSLIRPILCADLINAECDIFYPPLPEYSMPDWGRPFLDAHGKIPEGIGEGKLYFVGGYDMCQAQIIKSNDSTGEHDFTGVYCRISLTPNKLLQGNSSVHISLLYGVCAPDTCSKEMVFDYIYNENIFLRYLLDNVLNMNITKVYCGQELDPATDTPFQVAVGVILGLAILIIIGTTYDGAFRVNYISKQLDSSLVQYTSESSASDLLNQKLSWRHRLDLVAVSFSMYSNIYKIFGSRTDSGELRVLNGLRYLSFVWAILGNTYLLGPLYQESLITSNLITALKTLPHDFLFQFVLNYPFNVDTFLTISGVLVAWWWLRYFDSQGGKMSIRLAIKMSVRHIVKKYWRLAPGLMFTVMFYTCLYRYFIEGPLYPRDISDADNCRVNWWVDMLMIHNLVRKSHMCLAWMFYVPMIFQIHVVALIVLVPLVIWPMVGYILMALLFAANIGITAYVFDDIRTRNDIGALFGDFLMAPWCRYGVFIIGMAVGIILHKTKRKINIHPLFNILAWCVSIATIAALVFCTYDEYKKGAELWSAPARTAYDVISHPAWGLCIGWIILSCCTGHGGVMNIFLEWNCFRPLSRLVYTAFLTSSILILRYAYSSRVLIYIDKFHIGYLFLGHLIYLVAVGLIFGLLWHFTISIGLENAVTCGNMKNWMLSGRYPREFGYILEGKKANKND